MGRMPTRLCAPDGLMIEPDVSVPMLSIESAAAPAVPVPDEEPLGFWSASKPWMTWPVRFEKPDGWLPNEFAYSDRPSLPRITAPAARSFLTMPESVSGNELRSEKLPADVYIPFASTRSLSRIGRPCAGPRTCPSRRSLSSSAASCNASWLSCVTAFNPGPRLFNAAMRAMYWRVSSTDVSSPRAIMPVAVGPSSVSRFSGSAACAGTADSPPRTHVSTTSRRAAGASLIRSPSSSSQPSP